MGRAPCCDKTKVKRGPWSPEEDITLKNYVEKYGTGGNWIALPQKAGLRRCGKSCRLRWLNYLRPDIKHGGFTEEEDNIIITLYRNIGSRWSVIASQLPGRTDNDVKNYWNTKLKKKLLSQNSTLNTTIPTSFAGNPMDFNTQARPHLPAPPLTKHQTNCYGNSPAPSLVSGSDTLMPYHEIEKINNSSRSNSNGMHERVVSELMFHNDVDVDDDDSNIIDNNNLPLPRLMEVQENGTTYNNSCCFTTTSSSQEISSLSSPPPPSYSIGMSTYAAAANSSNWSDNAVVVGEEVLGFLVEFGSKPHSSSSLSSNNNYTLLNGFDYQEKLLIGTDDDQEIHIPTSSSTTSNLVNYSYSGTSTSLLANISENEPAGHRHHQN